MRLRRLLTGRKPMTEPDAELLQSAVSKVRVTNKCVTVTLKNGQTIGKKIFGLAVMQTDSVRVKPIAMLIRTLLGKYTIETMAPLLIIFLILFGSLGTVGLIMLAVLAKEYLALGGLLQAAYHIKRCAFAAAGRTEQAYQLSVGNGKAAVVYGYYLLAWKVK